MSDEYTFVASKGLKFKNSDGIGKKKSKKKREKDRIDAIEAAVQANARPSEEGQIQDDSVPGDGDGPGSSSSSGRHRPVVLTKAEHKFRETQERLAAKRIMEKASKSHKQRVEQFNRHLDSLTEHYDIPKVSWTK